MIMQFGSPSAKQKEFLTATERHVAYGGARGGGKSWAVREKARLMAIKWPGIKQLIVRRTLPELERNHVQYLTPMLQGIAKYNEQKKIYKFANGSTIALMYCEKDKDLDRLQGAEYDIIYIDEATQLTEHQLRSIAACNRGTGDYPRRIYYTCNPGGPSHAYIKRVFVDRRFEGKEEPENYKFIQALVTDNDKLMEADPEYVKVLDNLPEKMKAAWRYGSWDIYEGQFFEDFRDVPANYASRQWTHVIEPFDVPANWTFYRSYDYGYNKPFSCAWWAVDFDGTLYRILELYGCTNEPDTGVKWTADQQFAEIARIEREHPWLRGRKIQGIADPAIWTKDGSGISIAERAMAHGVYFTQANNDRINGWAQCHYRLQFDERGIPQMYVFSNCTGFRRTVPTLMYDKVRVEDLDTKMEDHIADDWRYMCMARPTRPTMAPAVKPKMIDPLDMMPAARRNRRRF